MQLSYASVVLTGTRVIYPSDKKFVNLNFSSSDLVPSIMELWVSKLADSTQKESDTSFSITPPIFRIDPNKGQSVKLIFQGNGLPRDRESVFYLNFLQMPATQKDKNKLIITYKSTVKVFYRPSDLSKNIDDVGSLAFISLKNASGDTVRLNNDSPFYLTPMRLTFSKNGKSILSVPKDDIGMIAPFSYKDIRVGQKSKIDNSDVSLRYINDLGAVIMKKIPIK